MGRRVEDPTCPARLDSVQGHAWPQVAFQYPGSTLFPLPVPSMLVSHCMLTCAVVVYTCISFSLWWAQIIHQRHSSPPGCCSILRGDWTVHTKWAVADLEAVAK